MNFKTVPQIIKRGSLVKARPYCAGAVKDAGGVFADKGGAEENAYFYNLEKEQFAKLKALREKSESKVKYEILKPSQIDLAHKLMYESGYPREPMVDHLGLCNGLSSIPDNDVVVETLITTYNMSLLARDKATNVPVGLVINGEFSKEDVVNGEKLEKMLNGLSDPSFGPIMAIRHEVDLCGASIFQELNTDIIFNTKFLMVKPEMAKQGLATSLLSRAIQQASALGYKGIKTVVSHEGFKKAAKENGMKMLAEIKFDEFSFKGDLVFSGLSGHSSCAFMAMKL